MTHTTMGVSVIIAVPLVQTECIGRQPLHRYCLSPAEAFLTSRIRCSSR